MKKISIEIDRRKVELNAGSTILDAANKLDIPVPTMCFLEGLDRYTSCMICVVHETKSGKLLPACSALAEDGMVIETSDEQVRSARKDTLDLLLTEHAGDCLGPCQRSCPAGMDIPKMIRQIKNNEFAEALITVKNDIALPAVLGRICHAPCEMGCHRKSYDGAVSICLLKRFAADVDIEQKKPYRPQIKDKIGKKTAVVGAGPAGLSAAYYLLQQGVECHIFDKNEKPGGMLRYGVPDDRLPKYVLDAEIDQISALGLQFFMRQSLGRDFTIADLRKNYDAVILASGTVDRELFKDTDIKLAARGISVNRKTYETSVPGIFAGGNALSEARYAIRAAAHGKEIAYSVNQYLHGLPMTGVPKTFNSRLRRVVQEEYAEFLKEAEDIKRISAEGGSETGLSAEEAVEESSRCFGCDCRKKDSCRLRDYSDEYNADQSAFQISARIEFQKIIQHDDVIYEPGKCIKCGLCIQIAKNAGEELGMTLVHRGFDVRVAVPFNEPLSNGLKKTAAECVDACPTAALSWIKK